MPVDQQQQPQSDSAATTTSTGGKHFAMRPIGTASYSSLPPPENPSNLRPRVAVGEKSGQEERPLPLWSLGGSGASSPPPPLLQLPATSSSSSSMFSLTPPPTVMGNGHFPSYFTSPHHYENQVRKLMDAAANNRIDVLVQIIRSGEVSVDATDSHNFTALMYAATNGHMNIIRRLLDLGASVDLAQAGGSRRDTALHMAAQCGHTRSVELLLKHGQANPHLLNAFGKTAFELARDFGHGSNKVMRRLFEEVGALSSSAGNSSNSSSNSEQISSARGGHHHPLLPCHQPSNSKFGGGGGGHNCRKQPQQVRNGGGNSDDKQHSLLPNAELLRLFAATGIYRPMLSGTGFSLLTPHAEDILQSLQYARLALEVEVVVGEEELNEGGDTTAPMDSAHGWRLLLDGLLAIQRQFEEDQLLVKHEAYLARVNAAAAAAAAQQQPENVMGQQKHQHHHSYHHHHQQQQQQLKQEALEEEKAAYLRWKRSNLEKLQELLEVVKCVNFELAAAAAANAANDQ
ncbi:hypothetical protein TYRP_017358 [Tyrophagus putrescentiae]|nr:hypothetical protein TYRP_017358 [Tyrophagus putrescentiae]